MVFLGNPEFGVDLHPIDFAAFAHACGGIGYHAEKPDEIGGVLDQFLSAPGPAILEAVVDPNTAPLPGKVNAEQALHFAQSLARGEKDAADIIKAAFKDKARELI
jgi:thiamine pyrophosphate-dependent acetolactate synthase large subunit-like protein